LPIDAISQIKVHGLRYRAICLKHDWNHIGICEDDFDVVFVTDIKMVVSKFLS